MNKQVQRSQGSAKIVPSLQERQISGALELARFDVSIILNLHNEARYLKRTLASLEEAVRYARPFDITFEIIVVMDNADADTAMLAESYDYRAFDAYQITHVKNGSLGLSRNDGIAISRGEYIATADGDDLISFDFFQKMYMEARSSNNETLIFPEYNYAFGEQGFVWKYYDVDVIGRSGFFGSHPYLSRVFCRRSIFYNINYEDVPVNSGLAYEDWHFNCQCLAEGYNFKVARGTILFYRQRGGSLLRRANSETSRLIPKSSYFVPENFIKLTWSELHDGKEMPYPSDRFDIERFIAIPGIVDLVFAANKIDPAVSLGILKGQHTGSNFRPIDSATRAYFELCRSVIGSKFTDVVIMPFLARGGAEKYILSVLSAIKELDPGSKILVLSGQPYDCHEWLDRLPTDSLFIDLHRMGVRNLDQDAIDYVVFRLIQNMTGIKRLHFKTSPFSESIIKKFSRLLRNFDMYYYYFSNEIVQIDGVQFQNGYSFNLLSDFGGLFSGIISDHRGILDEYAKSIGKESARNAFTIYAERETTISVDLSRGPKKKILWASRIDSEKRPELLKAISSELLLEGIDVTIGVFGTSAYGVEEASVFSGAPNIQYNGPFNDFSDLPISEYDAFIYTTRFDGLPNVILEALEAGLPVIAPDVGGIGEAVTSETGYLLGNENNDAAMVDNYIEAIKSIYEDWPGALRRGQNGRQLMLQRHSREAFLARVQEIFGLPALLVDDAEVRTVAGPAR